MGLSRVAHRAESAHGGWCESMIVMTAYRQTSHLAIDPIRVRQIARKTASDAIEAQKEEMQDIGIMADWDAAGGTYQTMCKLCHASSLSLTCTL